MSVASLRQLPRRKPAGSSNQSSFDFQGGDRHTLVLWSADFVPIVNSVPRERRAEFRYAAF
jgi:hypothetical protein